MHLVWLVLVLLTGALPAFAEPLRTLLPSAPGQTGLQEAPLELPGSRPGSWQPSPNADRKMCVVIQHHLAKGARCAPPLDPPGLWRVRDIEPLPAPSNRIAG